MTTWNEFKRTIQLNFYGCVAPDGTWFDSAGDFSVAIKRWEQITGRLAPEPTLPDGQKGQERLSAKFTEWLMGLPDGWITGHGLHRKDAIKMAGNGVVPQQAKLALSILREGLE
jgi:DNA (cytosine-5)-methyltransferase 1